MLLAQSIPSLSPRYPDYVLIKRQTDNRHLKYAMQGYNAHPSLPIACSTGTGFITSFHHTQASVLQWSYPIKPVALPTLHSKADTQRWWIWPYGPVLTLIIEDIITSRKFMTHAKRMKTNGLFSPLLTLVAKAKAFSTKTKAGLILQGIFA